MWRDPIVDETRKVRDEYAKLLNYDLRAIYQDLKNQEKTAGKKTVSFPPKPAKPLKV